MGEQTVVCPGTKRPGRSSDRGSGSLLAIALGAAIALVAAAVVPLYIGMAIRQRVIGAADAAALAAADVASGRIPGFPCDVASRVAAANRVSLFRCELDGSVVLVGTGTEILGVSLSAESRAGPAD